MTRRYDELFSDIVRILRRDYAGCQRCAERFDPRYYNQAIGQAWHDGRLDELRLYNYVNQMLACVGDRHLRLTLRGSPEAASWPGFRVRRYGDALYVTEAAQETRLRPGDRIDRINGGDPAYHRAHIQKNIFWSEEPDREDWGGLLALARDVTLADGRVLALERYPRGTEPRRPGLRAAGGALVVDPGDFDGSGALTALLRENAGALRSAGLVVWDLRRAGGADESDIPDLLPYLCAEPRSLRSLLGPTELYVNYTRRNCALRDAAAAGLPGAEEYRAELRQKAGRGFLYEREEGPEGMAEARGPAAAAVLTDTACRGAAESFALAARRAGARLIGRPTMGTLAYCADVSAALDERFVFTWPTAVSAEAWTAGPAARDRGAQPDTVVPWTPEELARDLPLEAALNGK